MPDRVRGANHLFDLIATAMPDGDKPFMQLANGSTITYRNLRDETARYANALVLLGVKPGDRVAAQVEKSPAAIFLYLACVRSGAIFLPLNSAYTDTEISYFLGDARPHIFVCEPSRLQGLKIVADMAGVSSCETMDKNGAGTLATLASGQSPEFDNTGCGPEDLAAILYTSGTTGRSKGAMLSHENLASNAQTLAQYWRFTQEDVLLHALPIFHTHGLFVATNVTLIAGSSMIFLEKFDADEVMRQLPKASTMMGVPTFYVRLLQHNGLTREATRHIRLFISGSAPLLAETHVQWSERTGHAILERYGMTETNMNTSNPYHGERRAGTVGFPLPGIEIRITNPESGNILPQDEIGMIEIKGPNVFKGYWQMPEKTASEFRKDGFFISGDLGKIDRRGYVHIVGRGKDLVITGGYNVYPKEIESEIDAIDGVVESAVIGLPHPDFGEGVAAVIVKRKTSELCEADVTSALKDKLAKFKQPKRVFFVDDLPRNTMGKVQKNVLRETYKGSFV